MAFNHGFDERGNELVDACQLYPPDFDEIRALLAAGVDLNQSSGGGENLLETILLGNPDKRAVCDGCDGEDCEQCHKGDDMDGRYLPVLVRLLLDSGFDAARDGGAAGARCIDSLVFSSHDRYILDAARLLLAAGANPCYQEPDGTLILFESVAMAESAADCCDEDHALSNHFHTLYEMLDAARRQEPYDGLLSFEVCIGRCLTGVTICSEQEQPAGVFEADYPQSFRDTLVFWCDGLPLCINCYTDEWVDPRVVREAVSTCSADDCFRACIGSRISGFSFSRRTLSVDNTNYGQPITVIHLDNGRAIRLTTNFGEVPEERCAAHFEILQQPEAGV